MRKQNKFLVLSALLIAAVIGVSGCHSGGGGTAYFPPSSDSTVQMSGTAAAGAPISGIVRVKGANGVVVFSYIDATGHYSLDVQTLTAPYMLYAEGMVNGSTIRIYSEALRQALSTSLRSRT